MKIYITGPDVFRKNSKEYFEGISALLKESDHEALIPLYPDTHSAQKIFELNCLKIRECDVILANLNQFRGIEPDSGTIWELGYGHSFGKKIIGYDKNTETLAEKTSKYFYMEKNKVVTENTIFPDGMKVETFGFKHNLMISLCLDKVYLSVFDAIKSLDA